MELLEFNQIEVKGHWYVTMSQKERVMVQSLAQHSTAQHTDYVIRNGVA